MKRTLQFLLAMSFVAMFLISPVAAATSQGLEWGIALNDEFTFKMIFIDEGEETFNEGINATIAETPPAINDPLVNLTGIDTFNITMTFYNGTELGLYGILFLGLIAVGSHFAYPVGNFSLLSELAMDESFWDENHTIINNSQVWGISYSETSGDETESITAEYLKADGFCYRYMLEVTNTTSNIETSVSFVRDMPSSGFDIVGFITDNALYIGIGVIIVLLLVIIFKKK
ncbi:MAG: hypothetical protein OEV85_06125 [Candidatus Thorarchaeota archaeon]|nr:hypothetical protein [Candidatus Thorarchaeota archaeon]